MFCVLHGEADFLDPSVYLEYLLHIVLSHFMVCLIVLVSSLHIAWCMSCRSLECL